MTKHKMKQHIMITRPAHQAGPLAQEIQAIGSNVFLFPTLKIIPTELSPHDIENIKHLKQFDIIIFISPNAVEFGLTQIKAYATFPGTVLTATIGQASAKTLASQLGKQPDIVPEENFNSEGLLALSALQHIEHKRVLIIRGNGGREHLKQTLELRGATVEYLNVYQRVKPVTETSDLEQYLQNNQIAAIVITSAASLLNLLELTPEKVKAQLLQTPLVLINQRLINVAREAGFNNELIVANDACDKAIIESLKQHILLS